MKTAAKAKPKSVRAAPRLKHLTQPEARSILKNPPPTRVDAHVHLWDPSHFRMPWLDGNAQLNKPFGIKDYREHTQGLDIGAFVYVQVDVDPAYALLEAEWVEQRAHEDRRLKGIVAWAPLEFGDQARAYLEALCKIGSRIKGVRRIVQSEPDVSFCLRPKFIEGVKLLPKFGLTCDICIKHPQLAATIEMVKQCPGTQFMLDHIGKPDIKAHLMDPWRQQIKALSALPNVMCKVSGLITEASREWTAADLAPYVNHVLECFGEDRVAFGSDWPVCLLAGTYERWYKALEQLTSGMSATAKSKLWGGNARSFYRLK